MTTLSPLQQAILEIGLEDLIPLPELLAVPEISTAVGGSVQPAEISDALIELLELGLISVWDGYWPEEPTRVANGDAPALLRDVMRYTFENERAGFSRTYISNVENIP